MKDTKKILRTAIYNALSGNITYDSVAVPVFDEKAPDGNTYDRFIILSTQQETSFDRNSSVWITNSSIDIEIYDKTQSESSKDAVNDIYEDVLEIIFPTVSTIGITIPSGFEFQEGFRESSVTQSIEISGTQSVMIERMRLVFTIVQQ